MKLSDIMRYVIYDGDEDRVPFKKKSSTWRSILKFTKSDFKKQVDITFEKQIDNEAEQIAPLMLVTLVENAFKHGVEQIADNAFLKISIDVTNGKLVFIVENNVKEKSKKTKPGIGLKNLRKRLELIYPKKHTLELEKKEYLFKAALKIDLE